MSTHKVTKTLGQLAEEYLLKFDNKCEPPCPACDIEKEVAVKVFKAGWDAHAERAKVLVDALENFNRKYSPGDNWNPEMRDALSRYRGEE